MITVVLKNVWVKKKKKVLSNRRYFKIEMNQGCLP